MSFPGVVEAVLQVRRRSDMENNQFVADDEIIDLLNDNLEIIYNTCVHSYGETVYASSFLIHPLPKVGSVTSPTVWPNMTFGSGSPIPTRYDLPPDFQSLIRCEWCIGNLTAAFDTNNSPEGVAYVLSQANTYWTPMHPFDITGAVYDSTARDWVQGQVAYWITADNRYPTAHQQDTIESSGLGDFQIAFLPVPKSTVSVHIQYLPKAPKFDENYQIKMPDLCWKYVRESTAADILEKQRSDSSALRANAEKYRYDVTNTPLNPDNANPPGTVDIYGGSGIAPYGRRRQVW